MTSYPEKRVRCIQLFDPAPGTSVNIQVGVEYDVEHTNIHHPNHLPIIIPGRESSLTDHLPAYCFETIEWHPKTECFGSAEPHCQPAAGAPAFGE